MSEMTLEWGIPSPRSSSSLALFMANFTSAGSSDQKSPSDKPTNDLISLLRPHHHFGLSSLLSYILM